MALKTKCVTTNFKYSVLIEIPNKGQRAGDLGN
jgi:hypothetical protein